MFWSKSRLRRRTKGHLDTFARVELDRWVTLKTQPTHNRKNQAEPGKQSRMSVSAISSEYVLVREDTNRCVESRLAELIIDYPSRSTVSWSLGKRMEIEAPAIDDDAMTRWETPIVYCKHRAPLQVSFCSHILSVTVSTYRTKQIDETGARA